MKKIGFLFPEGKKKALTLSYDDGVWQDKRLIDILNKHGLKCTFNLNSNKVLCPQKVVHNNIEIMNIPEDRIRQVYEGHEIATHGYSHPWFTKLPAFAVSEEIRTDRVELERITGSIVRGHAYPFGAYDGTTIDQLENNFIAYARTVVSTEKFGFPENFLEWHPTCHHNSPALFELLDKFLGAAFGGALFYLWGHSYEFDTDGNWELIEQFAAKASGHDDIWYATNMEIYDYISAFRNLTASTDGSIISNPGSVKVWLELEDMIITVDSGETVKINN